MNRVCTLLFVAHHVAALAEWSSWVLQHVPKTQRIAIQPTLLTQLAAERAQWLVVERRVVYVLTLIHFPHNCHVLSQEKAFVSQPVSTLDRSS